MFHDLSPQVKKKVGPLSSSSTSFCRLRDQTGGRARVFGEMGALKKKVGVVEAAAVFPYPFFREKKMVLYVG